MDKKAWIAVTLSIIGIVAWQYYYTKQLVPPPAPETTAPALPSATAPSEASAASSPAAAPTPAATPVPAVLSAPAGIPSTVERVDERVEPAVNSLTHLYFTNRGGGIAEVMLLDPQHRDAQGGHIELNHFGGLPIGSLTEKPGDVEQAATGYEFRREGDAIVYERVTKDGLKITKKFTPSGSGAPEPYLTQLEITFTNTGAQTYRDEGLYLHTGSAAPIHTADQTTYIGFDYLRSGKHKETALTHFDSSGMFSFLGFGSSASKPAYLEPVDKVTWVGVKNQFYTTIVTPILEKAGDELPTRGIWANQFVITPPDGDTQATKPIYAIAGAVGLAPLKLDPGASQTVKFSIFTGPRSYGRLKALGRGEEEMMNFGMFSIVSVFLLNSMNFIKGWVGNYALAIVLLTILIKALLWPLQSKATRSQKQMSLLAPKMKELQEKYKDDPTRLNSEVMKMYKDYGVSPVGGCLPMVAQMPIFLGFYYMLGTAVELRNASFLWVKDLTQPDTIAHLFGFPVNPLPLLMAATMLWQMAITPKTGDPKQQRMMMFMPLIFIFFCYNFAAALALYWTAQNLLTVLQTYLTRHQPLPALVKRGADDGAKPAKARVVGTQANTRKKAPR